MTVYLIRQLSDDNSFVRDEHGSAKLVQEFSITLFWYQLRNIFAHTVVQLVIFISIVFVSQFSRMAETLTVTGFSVDTFILPLIFIVMPMLPFVIPLSFFFGCITSFSQFSSQGGVVALAAAGVSFKRIYSPIGVLSVFLFFATYLSFNYLSPYGHRELDNFFVSRAQSSIDNFIKNKLQPGVFADSFLDHIFYTESIDELKQKMSNVFIVPRSRRESDSDRNLFAVFAPKGELTGSVRTRDLGLELSNGTIHYYEDDADKMSVFNFKHLRIDLVKLFEQKFRTRTSGQDSRALSTSKLKERVLFDTESFNSTDPGDETFSKVKRRYYRSVSDYYQRLYTPFIVFVVGLFGFALGVVGQNRGRSQSVLLTVAFIVYLYAQISLFRWLMIKGVGQPWLMGLIPHIISMVVAIFLVRRRVIKPLNESIFSRN